MKAIVLAGGKGTRLRPLTNTVPKPLIPIGEKNLTEHIFDILKKFGVTEIILWLGYMAEEVQKYFSTKDFNLPITFLVEKQPRGTAGPLLLLKEAGDVPKKDFIMLNGDNLFAVDLKKITEYHQQHPGHATIGLTTVDDPTQFGVARLNGNIIAEFVEKPSREKAPSNFINSGYYVLSPEVFDFVPDKEFAMMETDVFPKLAKAGLLYGFPDGGQWFDTGTHKRYEHVKREWRGV